MSPLSRERLRLLRAVLAEKGLAAPSAGEIRPRAERQRAPLSAAQERLFFLELYRPGTALHNDALLVRIGGELDPALLARALARIAERHEILRSSFALGPGEPEQRLHAPGPAPLRVLDLAGARDAAACARRLVDEDARAPFDLERSPAWRVTLARLARDEWWLALTMHHLVSDGASAGILFDELSALHGGVELAPLALQFGDYAAWERARADERRDAARSAYWERALAGELPSGALGSIGTLATQQGAQVPLALGAQGVARLAELARGTGATSSQVLLAAWLALLGAASGEREVLTGVASSLRTRRELEPLIGFFVQSLPLRLDLGGDPCFAELVGRVRAAVLAAQEHGELPYDRIARAAGRSGRAAPLFRTFFSHMRDAIRAPSFAGAKSSWEFVDPGVARFELALVLHETAAALAGFLEYDLGLFTPAAAESLARDWSRLLGTALERPALRLSELGSLCESAARGAPRRVPPAALPRPRRATGGGA